MYNETVKQQYLAGFESDQRYKKIERLLKKAEEFELRYGDDIGILPRENCLELLNSYNYYGIASCRTIAAFLNNYRRWYHSEILRSELDESPILADEMDIPGAMRRSLFLSWNDVTSEFVDVEYWNGDPVAPLLCLNWLGFKTSVVVLLKEDQVDWKNGLIFDKNHDLIVRNMEPEIVSILSQYKNAETGTRTRNRGESVEKVDTGYFLHRMSSDKRTLGKTGPFLASQVTYMVDQAAKRYENKTGNHSRLCSTDIIFSGCLRRVHEYLRTNPDKTSPGYQLELKRLMCNPNMPKWDIEEMHRQWTIAFGLNFGPNDVYP